MAGTHEGTTAHQDGQRLLSGDDPAVEKVIAMKAVGHAASTFKRCGYFGKGRCEDGGAGSFCHCGCLLPKKIKKRKGKPLQCQIDDAGSAQETSAGSDGQSALPSPSSSDDDRRPFGNIASDAFSATQRCDTSTPGSSTGSPTNISCRTSDIPCTSSSMTLYCDTDEVTFGSRPRLSSAPVYISPSTKGQQDCQRLSSALSADTPEFVLAPCVAQTSSKGLPRCDTFPPGLSSPCWSSSTGPPSNRSSLMSDSPCTSANMIAYCHAEEVTREFSSRTSNPAFCTSSLRQDCQRPSLELSAATTGFMLASAPLPSGNDNAGLCISSLELACQRSSSVLSADAPEFVPASAQRPAWPSLCRDDELKWVDVTKIPHPMVLFDNDCVSKEPLAVGQTLSAVIASARHDVSVISAGVPFPSRVEAIPCHTMDVEAAVQFSLEALLWPDASGSNGFCAASSPGEPQRYVAERPHRLLPATAGGLEAVLSAAFRKAQGSSPLAELFPQAFAPATVQPGAIAVGVLPNQESTQVETQVLPRPSVLPYAGA